MKETNKLRLINVKLIYVFEILKSKDMVRKKTKV